MTKTLSLEQLRAAPLGLSCPFSLEVPGKQALVCEEVFRHLPGRRLAFRCHWAGAAVLVKLFFRRKDFDRERAGLAAMRAAGVPAPAEVWTLKDEPAECFLLATEFLNGAESLHDVYRRNGPQQFVGYLQQAVGLTGRLHAGGYMQADIHLDNFLLQGDILFLVDGGGVEPLQKPLDNLGLLFAQMIPDYDVLAGEVIDAYGENAPGAAELLSAIKKMRERRIQHYLEKSTRNCTQFQVVEVNGAFVVVAREFASQGLLRLMAQPEAGANQPAFLKQGNSATVTKVKGDHGDWVLKRYNIKSFWHGLSRCWRPSRAWISWKSAHRLELLGIATPKPLGMRENRIGPLRREAYLLTEHVEGENLQAWLLRHGGERIPEWLDREICSLFERMWQGAISHGDMKATNLIVCNQSLVVIDLDALAHHRGKSRFLKHYRRDLQRFMDNWQGETWQHFERLLQPLAGRAGITFVNKKV